MKRRVFLSDLIKFMSLNGIFSLANKTGAVNYSKKRSKNWMWLTPDTRATDDEWKARFERLKNAGFDAILPEIYAGRGAYFASHRMPVLAELLERLVPIAHASGLELHAWMWTMPCLLQDVQKNHPDWYNVNRLGESSVEKPAYVDYYKFLCPAREEVHEFIQGTVNELCQYDVDGIHLDYVRYPDVILAKGLWAKYNLVQDKEYPQFDYCYCETCRKKFKEQSGIDPLDIKDPSIHDEWIQFRYDQVTHLVNDKLIPIGHKYGKIMSAAVFPNWKSVRQQWHVWKLDVVLPMLYNQFYLQDEEWIKQQCIEGIHSLKYDTKLYSGLMLDEPDKFRKYIVKSFEGGANGISVFSYRGLKEEHYNILSECLAQY